MPDRLPSAAGTAVLSFNDSQFEFPSYPGTIGPSVVDISKF